MNASLHASDDARHTVVTFFRALDGHLVLEERLFAPTESAAIAAAHRLASDTTAATAMKQVGGKVEILCQCGPTSGDLVLAA